MNRYDKRGKAYQSRPPYPVHLIFEAMNRLQLSPNDTLLELGSGTGHLTQMLLDFGSTVLAVEPSDMRLTAKKRFLKNPKFYSIPGNAIDFNIPTQYMGNIQAFATGQSLHWWRDEFREAVNAWHEVSVTQPKMLALVYYLNENDFLSEIDSTLSIYCTNYNSQPVKLLLRNSPGFSDQEYARYFEPDDRKCVTQKLSVSLDELQFSHIMESFSFMPDVVSSPDEFNYLMKAIKDLFKKYQSSQGKITLQTIYKCWSGTLIRGTGDFPSIIAKTPRC